MRLQYIYHGEDNDIHPFYVNSNWEPPVQQSVALESYMYLEEIKMQLAETPITKPKHNLPLNERKAITKLKDYSEINVKKADKGTAIVITNKRDKTQKGQILLDDRNNYTPLEEPAMVEATSQKVKQITEELYQGNYIDGISLQEEGINTVCKAYASFLRGQHPHPHPIPQRNSKAYPSREFIWIQR